MLKTLVATVTDNINFIVIMLLVVFFFSCHNYLQEFIMTFPGFHVSFSSLLICRALLQQCHPFAPCCNGIFTDRLRWASFSDTWRCWA